MTPTRARRSMTPRARWRAVRRAARWRGARAGRSERWRCTGSGAASALGVGGRRDRRSRRRRRAQATAASPLCAQVARHPYLAARHLFPLPAGGPVARVCRGQLRARRDAAGGGRAEAPVGHVVVRPRRGSWRGGASTPLYACGKRVATRRRSAAAALAAASLRAALARPLTRPRTLNHRCFAAPLSAGCRTTSGASRGLPVRHPPHWREAGGGRARHVRGQCVRWGSGGSVVRHACSFDRASRVRPAGRCGAACAALPPSGGSARCI